MARLPRLVISNQPHHVIQRGNDRQVVFRDEADYAYFLKQLQTAAKQFAVAIHAYVLMPNHLHLLATPSDSTGLARMMQWVGRYYVPYFNRRHQRAGTLWQGRYKTTVIESERYFLICSRYIELNPVRAGLLTDPALYPWSSYAHHVGMKTDLLITEHALYWALGNTPFARESAYRALIAQALTGDELAAMAEKRLKGRALGSTEFQGHLEQHANQRVLPAKRGRPAKAIADGN